MSTKTYTIQLDVCFDAENEEEVHKFFIDYLHEIVLHEDLTAFLIQENKNEKIIRLDNKN